MSIFQGYRNIDFGTEKLLWILADDPKLCRGCAGTRVNLVLPQFAAKRAAGYSELLGGLGAMPAGLLERPNDHLLFHVFEVAERHRAAGVTCASGPAHRFATQLGNNFSACDLPVLRRHREFCDQVPQFTYVPWPRMCLHRNQCTCSQNFIRGFQRPTVTRQRGNIFGTLAQWRNAQLELAQAVKKILAETP